MQFSQGKCVYSFDTSSIMDMWVRWYTPEIFPSLWAKIDKLIDENRFKIVDAVFEELQKKDDSLKQWTNEREKLFKYNDMSESLQLVNRKILNTHPRLIDSRDGRSGADPWVIALAKDQGMIVVSGEHYTNSSGRPHIPDVCRAHNVECISTLDFIKKEEWIF